MAADNGHVPAAHDTAKMFYVIKCGKGETKYLYEVIYYCKKFLKELSKMKDPDEEINPSGKKWVEGRIKFISGRCRVCKKVGPTTTCSKCTCAYYCGAECQRAHWKDGHKQECKKLDFVYP
jgi:hypothetical protein